MLIAALTIFIIAGIILLVWAWVTALNYNDSNEFWDWGSSASWELDYEDDNHTERDTIV